MHPSMSTYANFYGKKRTEFGCELSTGVKIRAGDERWGKVEMKCPLSGDDVRSKTIKGLVLKKLPKGGGGRDEESINIRKTKQKKKNGKPLD